MEKKFDTGLVWFRRDLRTDDHAALYHALKQCQRVYCVFVFDRDILDTLPRADRRVEFIHASVVELDRDLGALTTSEGGGLIVLHAAAWQAVPALAASLGVQAVYANHDDEPDALARDARVRNALGAQGVVLHTYKDHCIFERDEVLTQGGTPFSVFTPYKNAWLRKLAGDAFYLKPYPVERYTAALAARPTAHQKPVPTLAELGFAPTNLAQLKIPTGASGGQALFAEFVERMDQYHATRDFPAVKGPSYLGVHLRFGTVSIRKMSAIAYTRSQQGDPGAAVWLSELVWRDFYFQILAHRPQVVRQSFKPAFDAIVWEAGPQADALFQAWCNGQTGYPLVDAAMAQINQTGYMHNRLRMVVASFLCKDLGLDWRWGESYFAQHLNDFDLSANNGGWQWASSTGCDAQPWFRIFNPTSQSEKFDPDGRFIRRYLPQLAQLSNKAIHAPWMAAPLELQAAGVALGKDYPHPIVAHDAARLRTLDRYAVVKKPDSPDTKA